MTIFFLFCNITWPKDCMEETDLKKSSSHGIIIYNLLNLMKHVSW